ncbi:MAG: 30S ribosome-binding factor RbfA [Dehalococcoidia bacterium]
MSRRTERVSELLRAELSELIQRQVKDPRLGEGLTSITEVDVSPDLRNANVYVSHLGSTVERADVLAGLARASHFLRSELRHRLALRYVPELHFRFDPSIERGARLASLINDVQAGREGQEPVEPPTTTGPGG